jgi:hypothetical protein
MILILCTIFRVWSTLSNQEMYRKFAENIVIVLIDTNDIMGTVNNISKICSVCFLQLQESVVCAFLIRKVCIPFFDIL